MVDIVARLDTAHGEAGPFVPKMNPEMWGLTMDQVTGHPSANHPITGNIATMQDLTDEEKTHDPRMVGTKTGGSRETKEHRQAREKYEADQARRGTKHEDNSAQTATPDRHATDIAAGMQEASANVTPSMVPENLRTTEAETAGLMTQKPIQAPALGPDGDGNVANDPLPQGDGTSTNVTMQSSPADTTGMTPQQRAEAEDAMSKQALSDAHHTGPATAAGEADKADAAKQREAEASKRSTDTSTKKGADGKDMPSRSALMAMNRGELEKFARKNNVDPEGATKEQIVDTLYE